MWKRVRGDGMEIVLAQMFCLRNGVRTKRKEKEEEGGESVEVFDCFCAGVRPRLSVRGANSANVKFCMGNRDEG
jgi:hypothetical protein